MIAAKECGPRDRRRRGDRGARLPRQAGGRRTGVSVTMSEVVARRKTADGVVVKLWSDGGLTTGAGVVVGQPARSEAQLRRYLDAGWLVMGEVEIYDASEVRSLLLAARWAAERGLGPGEMRGRLHRQVVLKPSWTVLETDRDGKPVLRCWVLPRVRWPGLAVFHERGTYSVCREVGHKTGTYSPTGFEFTNLRQLTSHLMSE